MLALPVCGLQKQLVWVQRLLVEQIYFGTYEDAPYPPFSEVVPRDRASLDTFKYVTAMVSGMHTGKHVPHARHVWGE